MMPRKKAVKTIRIRSFGSLVGLLFERGGSAEVLMTFPELSRLVDAWSAYERAKTRADEETLEALNVLRKRARRFDAAFIVEVPIAQRRARIVPVVEA